MNHPIPTLVQMCIRRFTQAQMSRLDIDGYKDACASLQSQPLSPRMRDPVFQLNISRSLYSGMLAFREPEDKVKAAESFLGVTIDFPKEQREIQDMRNKSLDVITKYGNDEQQNRVLSHHLNEMIPDHQLRTLSHIARFGNNEQLDHILSDHSKILRDPYLEQLLLDIIQRGDDNRRDHILSHFSEFTRTLYSTTKSWILVDIIQHGNDGQRNRILSAFDGADRSVPIWELPYQGSILSAIAQFGSDEQRNDILARSRSGQLKKLNDFPVFFLANVAQYGNDDHRSRILSDHLREMIPYHQRMILSQVAQSGNDERRSGIISHHTKALDPTERFPCLSEIIPFCNQAQRHMIVKYHILDFKNESMEEKGENSTFRKALLKQLVPNITEDTLHCYSHHMLHAKHDFSRKYSRNHSDWEKYFDQCFEAPKPSAGPQFVRSGGSADAPAGILRAVTQTFQR
jgi:hypothetical protein